MNNNITIVSSLLDLRRGELSDSFKRSFDHYKEKFKELLACPDNMFIYCSQDLESFIWENRENHNTKIKIIEVNELETWFPFYNEVQIIRTNPDWYNQASWLAESPQANLEYYNPLVMSKMFMLNDIAISNPFGTDYFVWLDAGITNTVHPGYFYHDKVLSNIPAYLQHLNKFLFVSYPYIGGEEIHGFPRTEMNKYCEADYVEYVCRGGFFGGTRSQINDINSLYYDILKSSLSDDLMGTEESIFTIISHLYPEQVHRFEINDNGLIWPIFEALKDVQQLNYTHKLVRKNIEDVITYLYILTYNSPKQLNALMATFEKVDTNFISEPVKYLINNSTDLSTQDEYDEICEKYEFIQIKKDNIGICGGRQFVAEHFDESEADYYIFFEDDMNLETRINLLDHRGFTRQVPDLYNKTVKIINDESYDYLKLSFCEFYGDNSVQWAWYNIPQEDREKFFPDNKQLPKYGLSKNPPLTIFNSIKTKEGLSYAEGEVYYCNWPLWVSRNGNTKIFIDDKFAHPFEQTWMSRSYQLHKSNNLKTAVLLASPIEHYRFEFYLAENRKEN